MPRKKSKRPANKRQANNNSFSPFQKMEKDFIEIPEKLATYLNKETNTWRKKEAGLKKSLDKLNIQIKSLAEKKQTKAHAIAVKNQIVLIKQLQELNKTVDLANEKQAKLKALYKHLTQFEKDWTKNYKKSTVKSKVRQKSVVEKTKPTLSIVEQPNPQKKSEMSSEIQLDDTADMTS